MTEVKAVKAKAPKTTAPKPDPAPSQAATAAETLPTTPAIDVPEMIRDIAATGVENAKETYTKFRTAAEEASDLMEDAMETARAGILDLNYKGLDNARQTSDATFDFLRKLYAVGSVAEAIELQSEFVSERIGAMTEQMKEMQDTTAKLAGKVSQPVRDAMAKSFKQAGASQG